MAIAEAAIIPKTIHYCWFGKGKIPPLAAACMASWKIHMPDWQYIVWNEDNLPAELIFARKLLDQKLYAFASDYVRLYAIWKNGGIYLDVDMEIVQPLDPLLKHTQFIGNEKEGRSTNAICGGIHGASFFEACLKEMDKHYSQTSLPVLAPELCTRVAGNAAFSDLTIYPPHVFYPYNPYDKAKPVPQLMYRDIKPDTLAIHHWAKGWKLPLHKRVMRKLVTFILNRRH